MVRSGTTAVQAKKALRINPKITAAANTYVRAIADPAQRAEIISALRRAGRQSALTALRITPQRLLPLLPSGFLQEQADLDRTYRHCERSTYVYAWRLVDSATSASMRKISPRT